MKYLFSFFIALGMSLQLGAQGIDFFHGSFKEALEESQKSGKPIFMDAYAKWCGPCKRMAATTFKDESVGEYFNKNFINLKIDWEESEGVSLRSKYNVSAFPTLFFISSDGEVIQKVVGGQDVNGLLRQGEMALGKVDYSREYAALYEKGDRTPELVYNYVKALNKSGKPSLGISNEYLRTQEDLSTEFNKKFILEAAVEADSRIFDLLVKNQREIGMQEGLQPLLDRIELACTNTLQKAIEFQSPELLEEAKAKMKAYYAEKSPAFSAKADYNYHKAAKDAKKFGKSCGAYAKNVAKDPKGLAKLATDIANNFASDKNCMKMAEKYAKEAAVEGNDFHFYASYAEILNANGKKKQALEAANKALEMVKQGETIDSGDVRSMEGLIKLIES
ncbi:MAG: thioredoxin family protein [Saprospiraceae bacterium]|nr:thioredoxin family protein [Saprospiraceae bacterium]MCF8250292.1 thioredoxin family protein [Saprospiraceae bacterium]MCF8280983.1 thioredoxin family protein [Bacteroidales bacterium]MCF8312076.1 thioredoxin family protein [Saprospiraceae bacterium]MCF8440483.1 thioredoxin family protein [Saprospiraceae bacterium]